MPVSRQRKRPVMFGLPQSHAMDRNQACRLRVFAQAWSRRNREENQHKPGPITRGFRAVLNALISFASGKTGSCFPSYEAIAERAECAESTVGEGIKVLERAGIIRVTNRITRRDGRVLRTSNAYVFRAMAPSTENRGGEPKVKESSSSEPSAAVKINPRSPVEAALNKLMKTREEARLLGKV